MTIENALASVAVKDLKAAATVSRRQGLFSDDDHKRIYAAAERQSRMLSGLRRSLVEGKEV